MGTPGDLKLGIDCHTDAESGSSQRLPVVTETSASEPDFRQRIRVL